MDFALFAHKQALGLSERFWEASRRRNYVTPRNFVDFLQTYLRVLRQKRAQCDADTRKYAGGLEKLQRANEEVAEMQVKI